MIRVLQINLAGKSAAQDLALQKAREDKINLLIVSEYYKYGQNTNEAHGWYCDKTIRAAIVNRNDIPIDEIGDAQNGFSWITVRKTRIYACYISTNVSIREYKDWLTRLELSIRSASGDVIVAGDFNAKHRAWGSTANDNKGESLFEFANALGLIVCNQGNKPTWQRGDSESHIDVTMASANLAARVTNWRVLEEYSHSDHSYIEYNIEDNPTMHQDHTKKSHAEIPGI
jgi:exonuclease III